MQRLYNLRNWQFNFFVPQYVVEENIRDTTYNIEVNMASAVEVERREHPRHPINLEVFISPIRVTNTRLESRIINMSLLGCAIEPNSYVFKEKEKLAVCFVASKEQCTMSTIIKAEVAHICDDYIGLCFESMGDDVIQLIRELLKEAKYF